MVNRYTKSAFAIIATALVAIAAQNGVGFAFTDIGYNDACRTPRHPVCEVTWTKPPPVKIVPANR
jgi:hypothetical protein